MRYLSTRGAAPPVDFTTAFLEGLAPDGGLYIPEVWPTLSQGQLKAMAGRAYASVAADILAAFAGESLSGADLQEDCAAAYARFAHPATAPLRQLSADHWMLELFYGPTLAFKDVAMQILARLYERVLRRLGRRLTIICATSGDTGGAAVEAFRGSTRVNLMVLFPEGRISEVQRRFMTTTGADNIRCVAVDGDFDACQAIVKSLFADRAFAGEVDLSGVNSINWARIAAQSVYFLTSAVALGAPERSVAFSVPTGNFGDAFAGYVARRMGLPVEAIIVATNANDILARALASGRYGRGPSVATQSPAMDIQVASNFERLFFEASGRNGAMTAAAFGRFAETGALDLPKEALDAMGSVFRGASASEDATAAAMRLAFGSNGVLVDPHTAVALAVGRCGVPQETPLVTLSTAHPSKFPQAVEAAAGARPALPSHVRDLFVRPEAIDHLPADAETVKAYARAFSRG